MRRTKVLILGTTAALIAANALAGAASASSAAPLVFGAAGWGSKVQVAGPLANSGRTALAQIGCTRRTDAADNNTAADIVIPTIGELGTVVTDAFSARDGVERSSTGRTTVEDVSLLSGDLLLEGIQTTARAWRNGNGFHAEVDVDIASITLNGDPIEFNGDEQVIDIAGVGTLTIARQSTEVRGNRASASGSAIVLELLDSTVISVANATASIDERAVNGRFSGVAYGTSAQVDDAVVAGRTAVQGLPCVGTHGQDRTNSTESSDLGDLGEVGAVTSTVNARQQPLAEATVRNEVADVTLELGAAELQIQGVVTEVHVLRNQDGSTSLDTGDSEIGSIVVYPTVGDPIVIEIPDPGTTVELPLGLGSITFFEQSEYRHGKGLALTGLRIDLPVQDATVIVGSARAAIKR